MSYRFSIVFAMLVCGYMIGCSPKVRVETSGNPDKPIKIEAHITIDIRQIKTDLSNIEDMVSQKKPESLNRRFLCEIAYAEEPLDVGSAISRRQGRFGEIKSLKSQGAIGEDNQGHIANLSGDPSIQAIVDAENKDREVIYKDQLKAKGYSDDAIGEIRKAAAELYRERAEKGERIQAPSDEWITK